MHSIPSDASIEDEEDSPVSPIANMDRTAFIRSQMDAHPQYANRIATEMFSNPGKYPIIRRPIIHDGYEQTVDPVTGDIRQWARSRPGDAEFIGWMDGYEHKAFLDREAQARADWEPDDG